MSVNLSGNGVPRARGAVRRYVKRGFASLPECALRPRSRPPPPRRPPGQRPGIGGPVEDERAPQHRHQDQGRGQEAGQDQGPGRAPAPEDEGQARPPALELQAVEHTGRDPFGSLEPREVGQGAHRIAQRSPASGAVAARLEMGADPTRRAGIQDTVR